MKVLVLGVTGMLGSAVFRALERDGKIDAWGTMRNDVREKYFPSNAADRLLPHVDVLNVDSLVSVMSRVRPDAVINGVGLIKQLPSSKDPLVALPVNAIFPHRLARLCNAAGVRLVHISTDCVFSGKKGNYLESDASDAEDLYGKSKAIGEVTDVSGTVTLRTSIIGHELNSKNALLEWFLAQRNQVNGYCRAHFSGLPTDELANVIIERVLPNPDLSGLYNVGSERIDKYSLLRLVAQEYGKATVVHQDDTVVVDRSLDSSRFRQETGYSPPSWPNLVKNMRKHYHNA